MSTLQIREDLDPPRRRTAVVLLAIFLALGALHLRLAQLQLVQGSTWSTLAENNRLRRFPLASPRGRIYDRRGSLLADNRPSWDLLVFPDEAEDLADTALFLAQVGVGEVRELAARLRAPGLNRMAPQVVGEKLSWEQVSRVRAHQGEHPELSVVSGLKRVYPYAAITAHAVGHLRVVDQETLDRRPGLDPNTLVGATGVEAMLDETLGGTGGERWVVVSAIGRQLGVLRERRATAGEDVALTLDVELQQAAAAALGAEKGSVVALDPRSGAVRALYSSPSFDPNIFVGQLSPASWRELSEDPAHPLQNRAIQGTYPPGSTIKPFFTIAGLESGASTPAWGVYCSGSVNLFGHEFRCWQRGGHGSVGLLRSLEASCDTYYYLLGQRLGIDEMARWLATFGFGRRSGLGLAGEAAGLIGTPEWSRRVRGTPWYPGEAVSLSIGQGPLLVTNLQLARGFAALANGGFLVTPHLVESADTAPAADLRLDPTLLASVEEGLWLVTHGDLGTARQLRGLPVAGKTGTAQVARLQDGVDVRDLAEHLRHHAWFVGWAPREAPNIVVSVLVEHGGSGGGIAAPVARRVFESALFASAAGATDGAVVVGSEGTSVGR